MDMDLTHMYMSLHVLLLHPHGAQERGSTGSVYGLCCYRAVSAAVRPLCAVGLSDSCQAVTLGPDSDGTSRLSDSAVRLSDTCCQTVRESAVNAVRLSGTVRRCPGLLSGCQSDQGSEPSSTWSLGSLLLLISSNFVHPPADLHNVLLPPSSRPARLLRLPVVCPRRLATGPAACMVVCTKARRCRLLGHGSLI